MKPIPYRPAISNVLIKASANSAFCARLLNDTNDVLVEMKLPPEDAELLANIQATTLKEYASQVRMRLMANQL
ncbi:MAG: hypothetical protein GWO38_04040 [Phycisphaerae bacterium]|nr:hypothetical protein [Phycisphaerae bacterium]NIX26811.1 hypothetical protein [Phycisphaerae bacterium]